jgi:hypothetical protein
MRDFLEFRACNSCWTTYGPDPGQRCCSMAFQLVERATVHSPERAAFASWTGPRAHELLGRAQDMASHRHSPSSQRADHCRAGYSVFLTTLMSLPRQLM